MKKKTCSIITFLLVVSYLCISQDKGKSTQESSSTLLIYKNDSTLLFLDIKDCTDHYSLYFMFPVEFGYVDYFNLKFEHENGLMFSNDFTGETFLNNKLYLVRRFSLSKKYFKRIKKQPIIEITFFVATSCPPDVLYKNVTIPFQEPLLFRNIEIQKCND